MTQVNMSKSAKAVSKAKQTIDDILIEDLGESVKITAEQQEKDKQNPNYRDQVMEMTPVVTTDSLGNRFIPLKIYHTVYEYDIAKEIVKKIDNYVNIRENFHFDCSENVVCHIESKEYEMVDVINIEFVGVPIYLNHKRIKYNDKFIRKVSVKLYNLFDMTNDQRRDLYMNQLCKNNLWCPTKLSTIHEATG